MKVSIITATYNRGDVLERSIKSVIGQTYPNWELIVVDDGSTDSTEEIVLKYLNDKRITYIKSSKNFGATYSRNKGIDVSTGDIIMVWDSDDELYSCCLEKIVEAFKSYPEVGIVSAPARTILCGKEQKFPLVAEGFIKESDVICKILPNNEKIRAVKKNILGNLRYSSQHVDFILNAKLAKRSKWFHLNDFLGVVYIENDGTSLTFKRRKPNIKSSINRAKPIKDFVSEFGDVMLKCCPSRLADNAYGSAIGFALLGDKDEAKNMSKMAYLSKKTFKYFLLKEFLKIPFSGFIVTTVFKLKIFCSRIIDCFKIY